MQKTIVKHYTLTIFRSIGKAEFFYSDFNSAKFSNSNERVSFATSGVGQQIRAIDIR